MKQVEGQSSPLTVLQSSQVSPGSTVQSPHTGTPGIVVVVVASGQVHAVGVPAAPQAPGHASSPPGAVASHSSPPSASNDPSPQVESAAVKGFAAVFLALMVPW